MPKPVKLESVPPVTATSSAVKSAADSLSVNVSRAVSPDFSFAWLVAIATVGGFVSMANDGESDPARLALPAASKNLPAFTATVPVPVKLDAGVNLAV